MEHINYKELTLKDSTIMGHKVAYKIGDSVLCTDCANLAISDKIHKVQELQMLTNARRITHCNVCNKTIPLRII